MTEGLQVFAHNGPGYRPLVYGQDWMVALLNYEDIMDVGEAHDIERHLQTDEVFILLRGRAAFYLAVDYGPLQVLEMQPGVVYNVTRGTWHNLLATREAAFAIVERRDTDLTDTHIRPLSEQERQSMLEQLPAWLSAGGQEG